MSTTGNQSTNLNAAKAAKKDEFYTQWADIEREMNAYLEYDPDVFRGKTVLLPCDDPEWSNFTKFFALHFTDYGIKKLISTSFAPDSNPSLFSYEPTLFELNNPQFDQTKTHANGKKFILERRDVNADGAVNIDDLQWNYLEGDGDFRSAEITALRDEADIVITNPPFSLFREFVDWLTKGGVKFSIIGNQNAVAYKEVFQQIRTNKVWLGKGFKGNVAHFASPYEDIATSGDKEEGMIRVSGVMWFTNLEHGRRHEPLQLMTMADNLKFNKKLLSTLDGGTQYQRYDNFDAIEVPFTDAIPSDYSGVMGVPITWLAKYNPDQFEILGTDESDVVPTKTYRAKGKVVDGLPVKSNTGSGGAYIRTESYGSGTFFDVGYPVKRMYKRIFISHRGEL
ncbi:adenine-specific methyltransferase EcoRI family protein [Rathayibacter sp. VKM Ac-2857]|uniref:adenine-specific methyltransferase EcoRI family protein n=1 Tax=Rathayibacter sp. VKM Ac-2857 TaxID=2739020 RepID=UPI0015667F1D|nr:adenine-specific methyltransferase EcoRI family protein [Rathayibacter sp. VKM Ac-2857]NQX18287.1 DNA methyltransferase [Rathayibacter sp. VKM Ac-2857]